MVPVRLRRSRGGDCGAELIEFAFILPLLLLVILGIFDFGFAFQRFEVLTNAAREGARVGVLPGYGDADITVRVLDYATTAGLNEAASLLSVSVARPTLGAGGNTFDAVAVTATYPHTFLFLAPVAAMFGGNFGTITLTATSTMRVEGPSG